MAIKITQVPKDHHKRYLQRAVECAEMMRVAFEKNMFNAAVILAVHCGISAADALTVHLLGVRHVGDSHSGVLDVLEHSVPPNKKQQLASLIAVKNAAEYHAELMTQAKAQKAVQQAERFLGWVESQVSG